MDGRPGPVVVDLPRDVQRAVATQDPEPLPEAEIKYKDWQEAPLNLGAVLELVERIENAERPVFYTGGGLCNSPGGKEALRAFSEEAGIPVTSTLMGLGAYPATGDNWLGMLGMFGCVEANNAMHDCDLMICLGARFDDRITAHVPSFSPGSYKVCVDLEPGVTSPVPLDLTFKNDVAKVLEAVLNLWRARGRKTNPKKAEWH